LSLDFSQHTNGVKIYNLYISVTLSFTQTIPSVSVQHAVEEIAGIPELSISQSVAAIVEVKSAHKMSTMNPFLCIGKRKRRERVEERLTKEFILSTRGVGARA
jgi:ABC-type antimicrobial peptide transport system permease subunit